MKNVDVVLNITFNTFDDTNPTEWTEKYQKWDNVISLFNEVNEMVQSRVVFTDEMILNFQKKTDAFFTAYIDLTGREGMTNYIHMLGAGHLRDFLSLYRNLYKYSQQSWEYNNHRACGIYHKHSQRGGNGAKEEDKSQILPIFRCNSRVWMWKTGHGNKVFEDTKTN